MVLHRLLSKIREQWSPSAAYKISYTLYSDGNFTKRYPPYLPRPLLTRPAEDKRDTIPSKYLSENPWRSAILNELVHFFLPRALQYPPISVRHNALCRYFHKLTSKSFHNIFIVYHKFIQKMVGNMIHYTYIKIFYLDIF